MKSFPWDLKSVSHVLCSDNLFEIRRINLIVSKLVVRFAIFYDHI